jgi:hypothetical protein
VRLKTILAMPTSGEEVPATKVAQATDGQPASKIN